MAARIAWLCDVDDDDMLAVLHVAVAVRAEPVVLLICPGRSCQLANVAIPLTHHPLLNTKAI
jgi:hypothetical protein